MRILFLILVGVFMPLTGMAAIIVDNQEIIDRIKPVGSVHIQQDPHATTVKPAVVADKLKEPGQATFEQYCSVCHQQGVAGAPKFRNAADWKPRMLNQTVDSLTAIAIKGLNVMPPRGTCTTCTDEDIKHAVQYMLPR